MKKFVIGLAAAIALPTAAFAAEPAAPSAEKCCCEKPAEGKGCCDKPANENEHADHKMGTPHG